jgi:oxygen-dependent protoporphyrinogen oxidase
VPAYAASGLLASLAPDAARVLSSITYASVAIVHLVYPPAAGTLPLRGSGMLVPATEGRLLAGCTWVARKWPHLAPPDGALPVRCFVGRSGSNPAMDLEDRDLVKNVDTELRLALGLTRAPRAWHVVRWPDAIPQYTVGHLDRMERVAGALADSPNVVLAGAGYRGSGLPDAIRQGEDAARTVLGALEARLKINRP